jgi:HPt (histidine-containing phosphotransfer) domain-containing protein
MSELDGTHDREKQVIANALDAMWVKYLPDIRERVSVLDAAAEALAAGNLTEEVRTAAQSAAHKLAGTLGTFGLQQGTDLARELESRLMNGPLGADAASTVKSASGQIRAAVESRAQRIP